jgi:hypothetical protein
LGDHFCWQRHGIGCHLAAETIPCNLAETQGKRSMGGVLEGVRVLDFGRYIAGPYCATLLAEFGAEVIRVEKRKIALWRRSAKVAKVRYFCRSTDPMTAQPRSTRLGRWHRP